MSSRGYCLLYMVFLAFFKVLLGGEVPSLVDLCAKRVQKEILLRKEEVFHTPEKFPQFQGLMRQITGTYLPCEVKEKVFEGLKISTVKQKFTLPDDVHDLSFQDDRLGVVLKNGDVYSINTRQGSVEKALKHAPANAIAVTENSLITAGPDGLLKMSPSFQESPCRTKVVEKGDIIRIKRAKRRLFVEGTEEGAVCEQENISDNLITSHSPLKKLKTYMTKTPRESITSDGQYHIMSGVRDKAGTPSFVRIEDAQTHDSFMSDTLSPEKGRITQLVLSPHNKHALVGTTHGHLLSYEIPTGAREIVARGRRDKHPGAITKIATTPKTIITGDDKGKVRIGERSQCASSLTEHQGGIIDIKASEEGSTIVTVGRDNRAKIFGKNRENNQYTLQEVYTLPLTPSAAAVNNSDKEQVALVAGNLLINVHLPASYLSE